MQISKHTISSVAHDMLVPLTFQSNFSVVAYPTILSETQFCHSAYMVTANQTDDFCPKSRVW